MIKLDYSIQLKHAYKVYPGTVPTYALNGIDVRRGKSISIVGPSGSGKSTLLNIIGAHDVPTKGKSPC